MVKYILSIEQKNKEYKEIKWNNSNQKDSYKLIDIDNFTIDFNDEYDLKEYLIKDGIIELDDYYRRLSINYSFKGKLKKMMYGISYKEDSFYMSEAIIFYYLKNNCTNIDLLEKLANHYRNSYIHNVSVNTIINYIIANKEGYLSNINIEGVLTEFVKEEIFSYDPKTRSYKIDNYGNPIIKYKNLHELGMFLSNYNKKDNKVIKPKSKEEIKEVVKPKTKVKTNDIEGQMSLFNM